MLTIHRHSIAQAVTTFQRPYALLCNPDGSIEDYRRSSPQPRSTHRLSVPHFHSLDIDHNLLDIICTIAIFVSDLTSWYDTGICALNALALQKHASLSTYKVFDLYEQYESNDAYTLEQTICLALLIFMVQAAEPDTHAFGRRLSKAVAKLHAKLQLIPPLRWSNAPSILIWVLTMGALGARSPSRYRSCGGPCYRESALSFFVQYYHLAFAGSASNSTFSGHLVEQMYTCLWIPSIFDQRAKKLWVWMGLCRPEVLHEQGSDADNEGENDELVDDRYAVGQSTAIKFFGGQVGEKWRKRC